MFVCVRACVRACVREGERRGGVRKEGRKEGGEGWIEEGREKKVVSGNGCWVWLLAGCWSRELKDAEEAVELRKDQPELSLPAGSGPA